ncbi:MAG: NADH-quinone oxidoreductase subunit K [Acidilobus sp.]|nr:NADH-quinone oxidoreductase subunit K [Acidilobus sp.]MCG2873840.1 NADH-quinone oxidoreductase subunit K [Acidilobus sp.]MCG2896055.1 NADH-quinone oxidoreductase subunit K [Acidilobus sp.]
MIIVDQLSALIAFITSAVVIAIGSYGLASSNNLLRQLLSVEVIFNGLLLLVLPILIGDPYMATYFGIVVVSIASVEVVVVVAIILAFMRAYRTLSSSDLEEKEV